MKIFSSLFDSTLKYAAHPKASYYLAGLSFSESVFFPIPVDVMLAPMVLTKPDKGFWFAFIAMTWSVIGGVIGYLLGWLAFEPLVLPVIEWTGYTDSFAAITQWLNEWGFWIIFVAGFSPIPYKLFTVGAGAFGIAFIPFLLASIIARGARFFLVAGVIRLGGEKMAHMLHRYIDVLGWVCVAIVVIYMVY